MAKYFFNIEFTDGKTKRVEGNDLSDMLKKQRVWVKKATKDGNIGGVSGVLPS